VFEEMRFVAARHPDVVPADVLRMGTLGGATALGLADQYGTLDVGKRAELAIVDLGDASSGDAHELLFSRGSRAATLMTQGAG
jgi:cytosine/adenosine deaminase-related metal-dependent hydrolase